MNYTAYQLQDAMDAQGMDPELSQQIAWALGDQRLNEDQAKELYRQVGASGARLPEGQEGKQGSSFLTNLSEGTGYALGELALKRVPMVGSFAGGMLGNYAGMEYLGGDKYYDRATGPQLIADMAGSTVGGMAGKALGAGIGRVAGGALGTALGPIGTVVGSALGGWLLPKLLPDGSKSVAEDNGKSGGGWGTLGAVAALPLGYKAARRFAPGYMNPFASKVRAGIKWAGGAPLKKGYDTYKEMNPPMEEGATLWGKTKYKAAKPFKTMESLTEGGTVTIEELMNKILGRKNDATTV